MPVYEIEIYKCGVCGEIIAGFDFDEHCTECENSIDSVDWLYLGTYTIEAETLSEACDKAIEIATKGE